MTPGNQDYGLFLKFFDTYAPVGFRDIDPADSLMVELEDMMETNNQFFYIGELPKMEIIFVSKRSEQMMGIKPQDIHPNHFIEAAHPDEIKRASLGRVRLFKMAHNVSIAKTGCSLLSTNFRMRNAQGTYSNVLVQLYVFYRKLPNESTYVIKVHTNIDGYKKLKHGYHYYTGDDPAYFRYPDEELLMVGPTYSTREFEIIQQISSGLNSSQIAEKLFISLQTVYTHRRNILKKAGKPTISDVIYDMIEQGLL